MTLRNAELSNADATSRVPFVSSDAPELPTSAMLSTPGVGLDRRTSLTGAKPMMMSSLVVGTPAGDQFDAVPQSLFSALPSHVRNTADAGTDTTISPAVTPADHMFRLIHRSSIRKPRHETSLKTRSNPVHEKLGALRFAAVVQRPAMPPSRIHDPRVAQVDPRKDVGDAPSWVEVDLDRLAENAAGLLAVTHVAGVDQEKHNDGAVLCGVVKKNAYGLGATHVARKLQRTGTGMLAVYSPGEAEELAAAGITLPLLVLMPVTSFDRTDALYRCAAAGRLHLTLHRTEQAEQLDEAFRRLGLKMPVHIHVDTGMTREGMSVDEAAALIPMLTKMPGLKLSGLMTHFATADNDPAFADEQHERFDALLDGIGDALPRGVALHVANSYATLRHRRFHRRLIRPGLGLYGYAQPALTEGEIIAGLDGGDHTPELLPVVRWCSRVVHVRDAPAGATVGYGATFKLKRDSVLGVVSAGYGDGYPLALSNKGVVRVALPGDGDAAPPRLAVCRVRGKVNMDQLVVDLTKALQQTKLPKEAALGCEAELYSNDPAAPNAVHTLAAAIKSHPYELLCRLNPRLPRVYLG